MNAFLRSLLPLLAIGVGFAASAQDEESLDIDALFDDDFEEPGVTINDPLERLNRAIFTFNDGLYQRVAKPFARGYSRIVPDPVERGVGNFFSNLKAPSRVAGSLLQGKFRRAGQETGRFVVDSTVGLAGFFRPSRNFDGLNPPAEDIGQAFATWGFGHGFYLVVPFRGPTSFRDILGDLGNDTTEFIPKPWSQIDKTSERYGLMAIEVVNDLPALMDLYDSMKRSAIDPYASVRDAYAQRRARQVSE